MILSIDAKNAMLQGLADLLNLGSNANLSVYINDLVVTDFVMPNPVDTSIIDGVLTFNLPERVLATESGTPTTAKLFNSLGDELAIFNVGTEIVLDKDGIYAGGYVSLTRLTITI